MINYGVCPCVCIFSFKSCVVYNCSNNWFSQSRNMSLCKGLEIRRFFVSDRTIIKVWLYLCFRIYFKTRYSLFTAYVSRGCMSALWCTWARINIDSPFGPLYFDLVLVCDLICGWSLIREISLISLDKLFNISFYTKLNKFDILILSFSTLMSRICGWYYFGYRRMGYSKIPPPQRLSCLVRFPASGTYLNLFYLQFSKVLFKIVLLNV